MISRRRLRRCRLASVIGTESPGNVKSPRSALTVGSTGIHHGKQLVAVRRRPVSRVLRRQAPRAGLRPGRHLACIFRRDFGESRGHNGLPRWRCRGRRVRAKLQWMQPTIRSGALNRSPAISCYRPRRSDHANRRQVASWSRGPRRVGGRAARASEHRVRVIHLGG